MDVGPASSPRAALRRPLARRLRPLAAGLAILALLAAAGWYVHRFMTLVFVDDARVAADMITVSSRVPGWVAEVKVIAGDGVAAGGLLVRIDDRDATLA